MVVLATAIEPNPDVRKIATMLTASIDTNNFFFVVFFLFFFVESKNASDQRISRRQLPRQELRL